MPDITTKNSEKKKSFWKRLTGKEEKNKKETQSSPAVAKGVQPQADQTSGVADNDVSKPEGDSQSEEWLDKEEYEGQLSVDVYQTASDIVIKSTIAGVKPEDIDISIQNDMITIRGQRQREKEIKDEDYFYQECYWGGFSRSIILPVEVRTDKIDAALKDGVLTVILPKARKSRAITVRVKKDA